MALDQLGIINDALLQTANDPINALFDGSNEWIAGSNGFAFSLRKMISSKVWDFSKTVEVLVETGEGEEEGVGSSGKYRYSFARPTGAWLINTLWFRDEPYPLYEIVGNLIYADQQTGLSCEFVREPADAELPVWFESVLCEGVQVYILRALNEDNDEAWRRESRLDNRLSEIASLENRQEPPRKAYVSKLKLARRSRRGGTRRPPAGTVFP